MEKPRAFYGKHSKTRSVKTNAIKCCLGHLVICVEVLSLLPPLSLHPHQTPTDPESAGSERPPAAQIAARTTTEREGREDRQRRTRTSRSPFPFLRARPRPAGKSGGKRHPQSERDDRRGEFSHAVNNKHKQQQQQTTASAAEDGHLAGGKRATETVQDVRAAE